MNVTFSTKLAIWGALWNYFCFKGEKNNWISMQHSRCRTGNSTEPNHKTLSWRFSSLGESPNYGPNDAHWYFSTSPLSALKFYQCLMCPVLHEGRWSRLSLCHLDFFSLHVPTHRWWAEVGNMERKVQSGVKVRHGWRKQWIFSGCFPKILLFHFTFAHNSHLLSCIGRNNILKCLLWAIFQWLIPA